MCVRDSPQGRLWGGVYKASPLLLYTPSEIIVDGFESFMVFNFPKLRLDVIEPVVGKMP